MKREDAKSLAKRKKNLESRRRRDGALRPVDYNLDYEISDRVDGVARGGAAALVDLARATGLAQMIDASVSVLQEHRPYRESDHVLALVSAVLAGGRCPESLRDVRNNAELLDSLGMNRCPDSTTAGDFLRRFEAEDVKDLIEASLATTEQVLCSQLSPEERRVGKIDSDGTLSPTDAECMEGIEYCAYKKQWGYAPLLISLADTQQPLCIVNRPGNAPSSQDAAKWLDMTVDSMLRVYERLVLRGDTDFSQTKHLDRWHETGRIDFVFGYDARPELVARAENLQKDQWLQLRRTAKYQVKTKERRKPERIKLELIAGHDWKNIKTVREDVAEFEYRPTSCNHSYRLIVLRKHIEVTQGQLELEPQIRYFFYITNMRDLQAAEIVREANQRCAQEGLIAQLKSGVEALSPASNTLESNWAWMVIASLAWVLKSWFALFAPQPTERNRLLGMQWHTFANRFLQIPVQVVRAARRTMLRITGGHLPSLGLFLDIWENIRRLRRIRA